MHGKMLLITSMDSAKRHNAYALMKSDKLISNACVIVMHYMEDLVATGDRLGDNEHHDVQFE